MKLNFLKPLFLTFGSLCALNAAAYDVELIGENGTKMYFNIDTESQEAAVTYFAKQSTSNNAAYVGDVVIPESFEHDGVIYTVTTVEPNALYYCNNTTSFVLPETVTSIGERAFFNCTKLQRVHLSDAITMLDKNTFLNCSALKEINLPASLGSIGQACFSDCRLLSSIEFPDNCSLLENNAFYGCASLKHVVLPKKLATMGYRVFMECTGLESVTFGDLLGVVEISDFENCSSLKTVHLGKGTTNVMQYAFSGCKSLSDIYCASTTAVSSYGSSFYGSAPTRRLHVPNTSVEAFHSRTPWSDFSELLPLQCAKPKVACESGGLRITTTTNLKYTDIKESYTYTVLVSDIEDGVLTPNDVADFGNLALTYEVYATATAPGVVDSDELVATLCWIGRDAKLYADGEVPGVETSIDQLSAQRPVLVESHDGALCVSGLADGERVSFYDLSGRQLGTAVASGDTAQFSATPGQIIVARVAGSSFKLRVR